MQTNQRRTSSFFHSFLPTCMHIIHCSSQDTLVEIFNVAGDCESIPNPPSDAPPSTRLIMASQPFELCCDNDAARGSLPWVGTF